MVVEVEEEGEGGRGGCRVGASGTDRKKESIITVIFWHLSERSVVTWMSLRSKVRLLVQLRRFFFI